MAAPVVFDAVYKKFRTGERHDSLRDLIPAMVRSAFRRTPPESELQAQEFWAVENVSFEVAPGEALGIIGPNGAGKSTTLKLLTRILKPNRGRAAVTGRIGALIEIAAGFHPDLTGRENIFLQGSIMGMKRGEVAKKFDAIVDFAGVGTFVDTQIKRYSSGMNARLGFAIAAHLDPDVLIIDEVLSVGDMAFQQRCVSRMNEFKRRGVTIVFVSHNLQAVASLCDRSLYLKRSAQALGPTAEVIDTYVRQTFDQSKSDEASGDFRLASAGLTSARGAVTGPVQPGVPLRLVITCTASVPRHAVAFAFRVIRATDQLLVYDGQFSLGELGIDLSSGGEASIGFDFVPHLTRGQYLVEIRAGDPSTQRELARLMPAAHLTIEESRTWGGVADIELRTRVIGQDPGSTAMADVSSGRTR